MFLYLCYLAIIRTFVVRLAAAKCCLLSLASAEDLGECGQEKHL